MGDDVLDFDVIADFRNFFVFHVFSWIEKRDGNIWIYSNDNDVNEKKMNLDCEMKIWITTLEVLTSPSGLWFCAEKDLYFLWT